MTDFGVRGAAGGATEAKQDTQITAEEAIQAACEILTADQRFVMVDNITFDDDPTSYTSSPITSASFRKFLLRVGLTVTGTPTSIQINVEFSHHGATWEKYIGGPFGSLMYEDTAGAKNECIPGERLGNKMRINVVALGTDANNYFTLTVKLILVR